MILGNGWIIAGFAGVVAARLLWQPLYDTLNKTEVNGLTFIWSSIVGYYGAILLGSTLLTQVAIGVGIFAVNAAIAFPLVLLFFNEGLKKFGELIKPILDNVYDAEKGDFRLFFHHSINIIVSVVLAGGALPARRQARLERLADGWFHRSDAGLRLPGRGQRAQAQWRQRHHRLPVVAGRRLRRLRPLRRISAGSAGWAVSSPACSAAAFWGLLILPGVYWLLEKTVGSWFKKAGEGLDSLHKAAFENVKSVYKVVFEKAQDATFPRQDGLRSRSSGRSPTSCSRRASSASGVDLRLPHTSTARLPTGWRLSLRCFATFTSYLVSGKLAKRDGGEPLIVLLCVGAASLCGGNAFSMLTRAWYWALPTAAVLATVAGYGLGLFIIPPVYAVIKTDRERHPRQDGWLEGWHRQLLRGHPHWRVRDHRPLHSQAFRRRDSGGCVVPGSIISAVSKAYRDLMAHVDRLFGRKKGAQGSVSPLER